MTQPTCETIRGMLSALIDGDLSPEERRNVEDHLRVCAACEAEARAMREMLGALRTLPRAEPPRDMVARIDRAIEGKGSRRVGGRARIRRHAVAAALVLGLVVGIIRVIPHGPGFLIPRKPPLPAARPAIVEEVAPRGAGERAGAPASAEARRDLAKEKQEAAPAAEPKTIGAGATAVGAAAPPGPTAVELLRAPRSEAAWAESVRGIIRDRPEDLVAAWKSLTPKEQLEVLAHWKRSAVAPGIAGDLEAAMEKARDPELKLILHALREFTP